MRLPYSLVFLLLSSLLDAGVERFLKPLSVVPSDSKQVELRTNAFVSQFAQHKQNQISDFAPMSDQVRLGRSLLERRLSEMLKHRYQVDGEVVVFLGRHWDEIELGAGFQIKIRDASPDELSANSFLRFSIWDEGLKVGDFSTPVRMAHMQEVLFASVPLARGSSPAFENFESRKVDVLKSHANSVPSSAKLSGYQIDSNLKPGSPLKWNLLSKVNLVHKGDVINVYASGNGIYVSMKGVALENGVEGATIRIKNISSEKEFSAKVLNEASVKVHL